MNIRKKYFIGTYILSPFVFILFGISGLLIGKYYSDLLGTIFIILALLSIIVIGTYLSTIRCPKCHKYLVSSTIWGIKMMIDEYCPHCGIDLKKENDLIFGDLYTRW